MFGDKFKHRNGRTMSQRLWKKTFVIILCAFPFYQSSAAKAQEASSFAGFYAGAGVGGVFSQFKTNSVTTLLYPSSAFFSNSQNNENNNSSNFLGTFYAGYLYPIKRFYIGPEVYVNAGKPSFSSSQSANATLPTESLTTGTNGHLNAAEFGIDLRLGTNVTPTTLLYGLVGAAFNNISTNTVSTISRPAILLSTTVNNSSSSSVVGLRLGAGIEQKISQNINLRVAYVYTSYPSQSENAATSPDASSPFFQLGPIANTTSVHTHSNAIFASLTYQFNNNFLGK